MLKGQPFFWWCEVYLGMLAVKLATSLNLGVFVYFLWISLLYKRAHQLNVNGYVSEYH